MVFRKNKINGNAIKKSDWIILIIIMLILSVLYIYNDLVITTAGGLNVWYSLSEGKLSSFYGYTYPGVKGSQIPDGVTGGAYDFFIYCVFALYNFPMWIWEKVTGLSVFERWMTRVYVKGILFVFAGFAGYWIYKIARLCELDEGKAKLSVLLFLSSGLFFYSEVVTGGYDIISVSFSLAGIYGYMKKNEKCFILSFAAAIATKLFALWIFIPLLLLREKRIWKLLLDGMGGVAFVIIPKFCFKVVGIAEEGKNVVNSVIAHSNLVDEFLFPADGYKSALIKINGMPLLFIIMFVIWLCCYLINNDLANRKVIYLCMLAMSIFFLTSIVHPYWIILLLPYLALIMSFHTEWIWQNMLLEILMSIGYICRMYVNYPWCGSLNLIYYMLQPKQLTEFEWSDAGPLVMQNLGLRSVISEVSDRIGISIDHLGALFGALFVAAVIMFLYINIFSVKSMGEKRCEIKSAKQIKGLYYIRLFISFAIGLLPIGGYILWLLYS